MKILLIDADRTIQRAKLEKIGQRRVHPNKALMCISTYHKERNDIVGWDTEDPDKVYISAVFGWNREKALGLARMYPDAESDVGGSGVDLNKTLPDGIDTLMPDYSLYPGLDYSVGSTTRGCIRDCYFCIVRKKEGTFRIAQHPDTFHNPSFKKILFQDNNILADHKWFEEVCDWVKEKRLRCDFNQGLDARLMTKDDAQELAEIRPISRWKIAYDSSSYGKSVESAIRKMNDAGIDTRRNLSVYVYCHDDSQYDDAVERCRQVKTWGSHAYAMINRNVKRTQRMSLLAHWTRPQAFFSHDISEYDRRMRA